MCILEVETEKLKEMVHIPPFLMEDATVDSKAFYDKFFTSGGNSKARISELEGDAAESPNANNSKSPSATKESPGVVVGESVSVDGKGVESNRPSKQVFVEVTKNPTYNSYMIAKRL